MTNTPKPQANTLDEILSILEGNRIDMFRHKRETLAKQQIQALITEARVDEIKNIPWKCADKYGINSPYITKQWYLDRLAQLKENK